MTGQEQQSPGNALVVGSGSIGKRHAAILRDMGFAVSVVSRHATGAFRTVDAALASVTCDYAVVASETSRHLADAAALREGGFKGPMLVEKPLCAPGQPDDSLIGRNVRVGYQLRFHPAMRWLKQELDGATAISVQAYVGQYLPTWRPGQDYRLTESAVADAGGGALNDLSHELDMLDWLFGEWRSVAALGGHDSSLDIQTDDHFALLCRLDRCHAATVELNYLDRTGRRHIVVNTDDNTYEVNLVTGIVRKNADAPIGLAADKDGPIRAMHRSVLSGADVATDLAAARRTMDLITAALAAARDQKVVTARESIIPSI